MIQGTGRLLKKAHLPFDRLTALSKVEGPFDRLTVPSNAEGLTALSGSTSLTVEGRRCACSPPC